MEQLAESYLSPRQVKRGLVAQGDHAGSLESIIRSNISPVFHHGRGKCIIPVPVNDKMHANIKINEAKRKLLVELAFGNISKCFLVYCQQLSWLKAAYSSLGLFSRNHNNGKCGHELFGHHFLLYWRRVLCCKQKDPVTPCRDQTSAWWGAWPFAKYPGEICLCATPCQTNSVIKASDNQISEISFVFSSA